MWHLAKYLRCHPDDPIVFKRRCGHSGFDGSRDTHGSTADAIEVQHAYCLIDHVDKCMNHAVEVDRELDQCLLIDNGNDNVRSEYSQSLEGCDTNLEEVTNLDPDGRLVPP